MGIEGDERRSWTSCEWAWRAVKMEKSSSGKAQSGVSEEGVGGCGRGRRTVVERVVDVAVQVLEVDVAGLIEREREFPSASLLETSERVGG